MTDPIKKESPPDGDKAQDGEAFKKQLSDLTGGKFNDPVELAKAYKELETKLGEQSREVKEVREFMSVAKPVFDVIKEDDKLFEAIDKKLNNTPDNKDSKKDDSKTTDQDEIKSTTRDMIRMQFETKHNFSKLSADEQKVLRGEIGKVISELTGTDFERIDLRRLGPVLENAYTLAKGRITDKSTQEAIAEADKIDDGAIPSLPSSSGKTEKTLSTQESEVASKLGLTSEQYIEGKK